MDIFKTPKSVNCVFLVFISTVLLDVIKKRKQTVLLYLDQDTNLTIFLLENYLFEDLELEKMSIT